MKVFKFRSMCIFFFLWSSEKFSLNSQYINIYILTFILTTSLSCGCYLPKKPDLLEGTPTTTNCTAKGIPRPTLWWTFDNGELPPDAAIRNFSDQSILRLFSTSKSMEGWYTCKAENTAGVAFTNSFLHVLGLFLFHH